jgi:PIN domain nuclease of toxin-antitoxin system
LAKGRCHAKKGAKIAAPNLTEAIAILKRRGNTKTTDELIEALTALGLQVEPVIAVDAARAAEVVLQSDALVAEGELERPVSLGDAICMAVAERLGVPAICSDKAWKKLKLSVSVGQFR